MSSWCCPRESCHTLRLHEATCWIPSRTACEDLDARWCKLFLWLVLCNHPKSNHPKVFPNLCWMSHRLAKLLHGTSAFELYFWSQWCQAIPVESLCSFCCVIFFVIYILSPLKVASPVPLASAFVEWQFQPRSILIWSSGTATCNWKRSSAFEEESILYSFTMYIAMWCVLSPRLMQ